MARPGKAESAGPRRSAKTRPRPGEGDQASGEEFGRERMGIAAKE
ncbi:MAG TPA: hypothetical protein VF027_01930 [Sphingomicrobium sp.]